MYMIHYQISPNRFGFQRFVNKDDAHRFAVYAAMELNYTCITMNESVSVYEKELI